MGRRAIEWSTDVAERPLLSWRDVVGRSMMALEIDSPAGSSFRARLSQHGMGPVTASLVATSPQSVERTAHGIRRDGDRGFYLVQSRAGSLAAEQNDRRVVLAPGEALLLDTRRPFRFSFADASDSLALALPGDWLQRWVPAPEAGVAEALGRGTGWGATLNSALSNLTASELEETPVPSGMIAEQIATLIALTISPGSAPGSCTEVPGFVHCRPHDRRQ